MNIDVIYSTSRGDCYESAINAMVHCKWKHLMDSLPKGRAGWRLVHTLCRGGGPIEGIRFGHAFLINRRYELVLDLANGRGGLIPAERYYELGDIRPGTFPCYEYSFRKMQEMMVKHETYGPWGEAFDKITKIEGASLAKLK